MPELKRLMIMPKYTITMEEFSEDVPDSPHKLKERYRFTIFWAILGAVFIAEISEGVADVIKRKCLTAKICNGTTGIKKVWRKNGDITIYSGYFNMDGWLHDCEGTIKENGKLYYKGPVNDGYREPLPECPQKKSRLFYKGGEDGYREGLMKKGEFYGSVTFTYEGVSLTEWWENGKPVKNTNYTPAPSNGSSNSSSSKNACYTKMTACVSDAVTHDQKVKCWDAEWYCNNQ
ncbi:MAG: hypothetical protein HQL69_17520 [Magnetococcales bacterium]|nr:hypothetical protein [Magnetococcales bacterium]